MSYLHHGLIMLLLQIENLNYWGKTRPSLICVWVGYVSNNFFN